MKNIKAEDLVTFDTFTAHYPIRIELAYARVDNLLFGERIYRKDAQCLAHQDFAQIILQASTLAGAQGYRLIIYDCLRTVDAQQKMLNTEIVQNNLHWLEEPRLLSSPGNGAHPRGMAVDVSLETSNGALLDMGTPFDELCEDARAETNRAHREHPHLDAHILHNRELLNDIMFSAARNMSMPLIGLPTEWWDFRFPNEIYAQYAPLRDADLPEDTHLL